MNTSVPLQFVVGLTRLIAVYFALRCLDSFATAVLGYQMQLMMAPEYSAKMPSVLAIYLPAVAGYLALAVATWIAAPSIVRLASKGSSTPDSETTHGADWNEVMIFLTGVLLLGWGLARVGETAAFYFREKAKNSPSQGLSSTEMVHLFISMVFIGCGGVMMARFPTIYRWVQKRSRKQRVEDAARNTDV